MNYTTILLITLCVFALGVGVYDIYNSKLIEHRCLDNCNKHWVDEFKSKCVWISDNQMEGLMYNYGLPNITIKQPKFNP